MSIDDKLNEIIEMYDEATRLAAILASGSPTSEPRIVARRLCFVHERIAIAETAIGLR